MRHTVRERRLEKTALWLGALVTPAEEPSSVPSTHAGQLTTPASRDLMPSYRLYKHACKHANTHTIKSSKGLICTLKTKMKGMGDSSSHFCPKLSIHPVCHSRSSQHQPETAQTLQSPMYLFVHHFADRKLRPRRVNAATVTTQERQS